MVFARGKAMPLDSDVDVPVHEDSTASIQTLLYEAIGGWQMLQQILVLDIVDFD